MNPKQFPISARHSCYSMLPVENKVQGEKRSLYRLNFSTDILSFHVAHRRKYKEKRGSDYLSRTRGTRFPIETTRLLREKL